MDLLMVQESYSRKIECKKTIKRKNNFHDKILEKVLQLKQP